MKRIAVYGTLKRGNYNHERFGPVTFVGKDVIFGLQIWTHHFVPYPFGVEGEGISEVEVLDVTDEQYNTINQMEVGAGYYPKQIKTEFGDATVWLYHKPMLGSKKMKGLSWTQE